LRSTRSTIHPAPLDQLEPFVKGSGRLRAGETVEIITPGAGGYGAPSERDGIDALIGDDAVAEPECAASLAMLVALCRFAPDRMFENVVSS
jgi:hypothetical protein